ncbi:ABC transporter, permease protein [Bordetella bronchiseptica GA96-01]|uniref:amino acid ABC transporter permease n=1 Tax=Bordetella bronchiseptica TaxID=518 RepID=UPI0004599F9E|nr:amino acid ABC transporter permease [Bordetella bronchiseptica]KCV44381.1 ABC transporter, permease protein [Bordetella bronchiseptica 345]KDC37889.1 ABC transporter, permease protein [Bordetella bronchiseptica GA96-01]
MTFSSFILSAPYLDRFMDGVALTLVIALAAWTIAVVLGLAMALVRDAGGVWCNRLVALYVAYHRNVPALVHILLWYFGVSTLLPASVQGWAVGHGGEAIFATIALGLCMSAYLCEDVRSGLRATSAGQREAARSLGMGYFRMMRWVVLPQAVRTALPSLVNDSVVLFKNTSMAMAIGVMETSYVIREIENETFQTFEAYAIASALYLAGSLSIMAAGAAMARKFDIAAR